MCDSAFHVVTSSEARGIREGEVAEVVVLDLIGPGLMPSTEPSLKEI